MFHLVTKGRLHTLERAFDYRIVLVLFAFTCLITFALFQASMLSSSHHSSNFWHARVEFFLTWGVFLAIVGAFYAVFAKRRADASFDKGEEIFQAITAFFTDYEEIMNVKNKRSILSLIENSERSLTFFLGSPLVGYFRNKQLGTRFYNKLMDKLDRIQADQKFKIEFLCWSDEYCKQYYPGPDQVDFENKRDSLLRAIQDLGNSRGSIYHPKDDCESVFRFVIADGKEAIFWLLEGPTPDAATREREDKDLKGGGFTSDREQMVGILTNLFKNTSPVPRVASPAPATSEAQQSSGP